MHESFVTAFAENAEDIQAQIDLADMLVDDLFDDGIEINTLTLLDAMARLGVRLAPMERENIASLSYFRILTEHSNA